MKCTRRHGTILLHDWAIGRDSGELIANPAQEHSSVFTNLWVIEEDGRIILPSFEMGGRSICCDLLVETGRELMKSQYLVNVFVRSVRDENTWIVGF